jgi:integrase
MDIYLAGIRSYCVDRNWSFSALQTEQLTRMKKGARKLYAKPKKARLPITIPMLTALTSRPCRNITDLSYRAAHLLLFFGCLRSGEVCWDTKDMKNLEVFRATKPLRRDVTFADDYSRMTFFLKKSKTDTENRGVRVQISANITNPEICPIRAMKALFHYDPRPGNTPLFSAAKDSAFSRLKLMTELTTRLRQLGFPTGGILPHSYRKGAADHMVDQGFSKEEIQLIGRWTSEAWQLYVTRDPQRLYNLSYVFQNRRLGPQGPPLVGGTGSAVVKNLANSQ